MADALAPVVAGAAVVAVVAVTALMLTRLVLAAPGEPGRPQATPPAVARDGAPAVRQVAASLHILVLLSDGTVVGIGENRSGQLGRPAVIRRFLPAARIDLPSAAVQVATAEDTSYALLDDGTVWAWGRGYEGQLGMPLPDGTFRATPAAVPGLRDVIRIEASGNMALAILSNGTVQAWGELPGVLRGPRQDLPRITPPMPVTGLADIVAISGGSPVGFALTADGRVFGWGTNVRGQLGLGSIGEARPPTELPTLKDVVSVAATAAAGAAVTRDGRVWTWGHNQQANLGNGAHADVSDPGSPTPQVVKAITNALEVKAGSYGRHVMVRTRAATLIGWGNSDWGQLGAGISGDFQPAPTPVKLPHVEDYWLGGNFSFARTADGGLWFWGEESATPRLLGTRGNQRVPARVAPDRYLPAVAP